MDGDEHGPLALLARRPKPGQLGGEERQLLVGDGEVAVL